MLTSFDHEEIIINSFTAGAVNYIHKENYLTIPKRRDKSGAGGLYFIY